MADLVLEGLRMSFGSFVAVEGASLRFGAGRLTALLGPSGCDKTTLPRMIAGLESPTAGPTLLGGRDITALPVERRRFGMVFQSFALFPHLDVIDNLSCSLRIAGVDAATRRARAQELLDLVQPGDKGRHGVGELSGGQQQRVAIARAPAQEPQIVLLDEPMSALDAKLRNDMQVELRLLQRRLGIATIVVTHDPREAMTMADRIVVRSHGRIAQIGTPQEVCHRPANAFVASFIGDANLLPGRASAAGVRLGETELAVQERGGVAPGAAVMLFEQAGVTEWLKATGWLDVLRERGLATPRNLRFKPGQFATILTLSYLIWPYAVILFYPPVSRIDRAHLDAAATMGRARPPRFAP